MVSVLVSGLSSLGASPDQEHCVVFLRNTLSSHSASLRPGVYKLSQVNLTLGVTPQCLASLPGESRNFLVASCYRNWDKLWPVRPLGSYADLSNSWDGSDTKCEL